jgi:thymidylate synthase
LTYNFVNQGTQEHLYFDLAANILRNGNEKNDRTEIGTISLFGTQLRFDISKSIPLLTTKQVPFNSIVKELLWILQGNTDAKILQRQKVGIWDGNTSREFLDNRGLHHYPEGVLGAGYGFQLRFHGAKYSPSFADTSKCDTSKIGGVDQLQYIEDLLQNDPFSRRIMFSYWNPSDFDKTALLPCHVMCQFYVTEENNERYLSCMLIMRSNDVFLGNPFNLVFYSLLTYILAKRCNMKPKELVYTCGDTHIYKNHIEQIKEQMTRVPRPFPCVKLDESIKTKDWVDITIDDFDLIGYFSHPSIKAPMAI